MIDRFDTAFRPRRAIARVSSLSVCLLLAIIGSLSAAEAPTVITPVEKPTQRERPQVAARLAESTILVRADLARSTYSVDGSGFAAAVLDTGMRTTHVDFAGSVVAQKNFTSNNGGDPDDATDGHGHGTNVAGIIMAHGDHTGIAPGADVIPMKVLSDSGGGSFSDVEDALQWVIDNRDTYNITVANLSLGDSGNYTTAFSSTLRDHVQTLRAARVAVVIAAGNAFFNHGSAQGMGYPGIIPECVSVGAVYDASIGSVSYGIGARAFSTGPDRITPFSQRLHSSLDPDLRTDIFATGAPITSAGISSDTGESTQHGTSQASPTVAGIILLMQEYYFRENGELPTVDLIEESLRSGAVIIEDGDDEDDNVTNTGLGFLRTDAVAAIEAIANGGTLPTPPTITQHPQDDTVDETETATFQVTAVGEPPLGYLWQRNGVDIPDATSRTYTTPSTSEGDQGTEFSCVVTNANGSATSNAATLTVRVNQAPYFTESPTATPDPAAISTPVAFAAKARDPEFDELVYEWDFGDGSTAEGAEASHAYAEPGTFTATVSVRDWKSSVSESVSVTVFIPNRAPTIASSAKASPNVVYTLQEIAFAVAADDADGDTLTYAWDFGDGSSALGAESTHAYDSAGTYTVSVTVSDGEKAVAESIEVTVLAPLPMAVTSLRMKVNFRRDGRDFCRVHGSWSLPGDFDRETAVISVSIGGAVETFAFSGKNRVKTPSGFFALRRNARFLAILRSGDWAEVWAAHGLENADVSKEPITVPIRFTVNGVPFSSEPALIYSARLDRHGRAK